jgi:ligand-binding sensor domain-containing protein
VVNGDGSRKKYLPVTSYFNNGVQEILNRMNDIYSIAEDLTGEIWIGTSTGVAVFSNPNNVWKDQLYYAYQPSLELNDGIYHPLLETETVTSIVVDGANRKWLGTKSSGIYLVSQQGDREILHFTAENSPLISNTIICLALNEKTGELYIGTDKGLVSYQGDAPKGNSNFDELYVYPNPVRETYSGDIVITGLMQTSDVKITDVAGNLVFKGESLGRNIIWDGRNLNGRRVSTGVYLIFCADSQGENSRILKLLVIN